MPTDRAGITMVSVVELYWVLTSCYRLTGQQVSASVGGDVANQTVAGGACRSGDACSASVGEGGADFADCHIERSASGAGCAETMTFDIKASKHAGMTLIAKD